VLLFFLHHSKISVCCPYHLSFNIVPVMIKLPAQIRIQPIRLGETAKDVTVSVVRLDEVHPEVSGNKWFKLAGYLELFQQGTYEGVVTWGGAYSNHIHATAAACRTLGIRCAGLIRGEEPKMYAPTLHDAAAWGMELRFLSRQQYRERTIPEEWKKDFGQFLPIPEGGYGVPGLKGFAALATELSSYTHILLAAGTGTTLAGLVAANTPDQMIVGVSVLKNHQSLKEEINSLLPAAQANKFQLEDRYHFGGYAKRSAELTGFMNRWYLDTGIPSDFVYTGKLFFALEDLMRRQAFPPGSRIAVIHSGGLQGNRSLPKGTLIF
jgi:1-aminocyclopropane-1-carboxylate deaminase